MSNQEGEDRARAAEGSGASGAQQTQLEALGDRTDPQVQNPSGLGPDNPHAQTEGDLGQAEMQERMDEINRQGRIGGTPDPTPDVNYSLLTPPDAPTPETHADLAGELDANVRGNRITDTTLAGVQRAEGALDVEKAAGTKTPAESQAAEPNPSESTTTTDDGAGNGGADQTDDETSVQALIEQGVSEEDARAQVATWKEGRQ